MFRYVASGQSSTHEIKFLVGEEFVVPTEASYSLYRNDGTVVEGIENEPMTLGSFSTSAIITIPALANTQENPVDIRYLQVFYTYEGNKYDKVWFYQLRDTIFFPLDPDEVRAVLGSDVPDNYIDILGAYDQVKNDTTTNLDNILTGGSVLLPALIDAVKYKAAINASTSLETSIMQMEQADNTLYRRFEKIDFGAIRAELNARYSSALDRLNGTNVTNLTAPLYSTMAVGTDPVTGQ